MGYVEFLYNLLTSKNLDVAMCNYEIYDEDGNFLKKRNNREGYMDFSSIEATQSMWYSEIVNIAPWGKLYKKDLWKNVRFEECFSEDFATMHKIYINAKKIGYSIVSNFFPKKFDTICIVLFVAKIILLC